MSLIFTLINQLGFAQVSTYSFAESASSYTALTSPSTAYTAPWDDHVLGSAFLAPLGFTFNYDGINQTQCYISPNGFISFGVQPTSTNYLPLSVATSYTNGGAISALGMDLISGVPTDNIVYSTIGASPNRTFVVQWTNARRKVTTGNFNFQIRLTETTNVIEISYGLCSTADATAYNTQVGIRGVTNNFLQGDINNRLQNGVNTNFPWPGKTISGTANSSTLRTSVNEYPSNGLKYTYTPSSICITPTGIPSALAVGTTSVTPTSFTGNSFTAAVPAPTNYLILRSTVNIAPTNISVPNRVYWNINDIIATNYTVISTSNSTSFAQTGLTPNTTYYYWVIPYNAGCIGGPFYNLSNMISASKTTCIQVPLGVTASIVQGNSFTASWLAVIGAIDYRLDVSTDIAFTSILPTYSNISTSGATTIEITGLNPLTNYYFRVRAVGINCNVDSAIISLTTLCGSFSIPYFQNFDTTPVNTVPFCFTISDENLDSVSWKVQNSLASSNPNAFHLITSSTQDSNDWFYTPGLNLTAGVSYRLKFKYNTQSATIFNEKLVVKFGTSSTVSDMTTTLLDLPNMVNTVYQTAIVDFIPSSSGFFYIGFQGYSYANQSKIMIDDISVILSPSCFEPDNVVVNSVTSNSATIAWDAPSTLPSNGYNYYVSTSNTQPSSSVTPTGSVASGITSATISGLTPATLYYVWVRGNCSLTDQSIWSLIQSFSTDCSLPTFLTVTNGTLCGGGSTTLQATGSSGSVIEWYADNSGSTLLATGNVFVTPTLSATTRYWAQSRVPGGLINVGPISPIVQGGSIDNRNSPTYIKFSVSSSTNFQSFDIYPYVSGQNGSITIRNNANVILATYPYTTNVAGGYTPQTISIGLNLVSGIYFIDMVTLPTSGLFVNTDNSNYPIIDSLATIIENGYGTYFYMYAYNWKFSNICRSNLTPVDAAVTTAPVFTLSQTTATICSGDTTSLVTATGSSAYNTFVWSPSTNISGSIGAGFTFNPTITTTYTLTASQSSGSLCSSVVTFTITVNAEPPAISIVPTSPTICQGVTQYLNANLATSVPYTIYEENFNNATNSWTTTNLSTGGIPANASWTLQNSGYVYDNTPYWNVTLSSNDASRFYFTNSDSQNSTSIKTMTYLESPSISLAGYTNLTLSFFHYLKYQLGNKARFEASIDGGATWTLVTGFISSQGTSTSFANRIIDLTPFAGNSSVKFRFYYDATWDYGWAVDNFKITGNLALEVNWSPITDLYFDSSATTQYIAGTPAATVYAKPNTTTIYTGTALGANGCSTKSTATINVLPNITTGTLSGSQDICASWSPTPLLLTGSIGSISRWEYAINPAFTLGLTIIANTTTTLTSAQIGTFIGTRYYRVVFQNGSCPIVYSNSVYVSFYNSTWNGTTWSNGIPSSTVKAIFNGNYTSTGDLNACSVEVISGNVLFNTGHTLKVQNDVKVTGGSLSFDDKSSLVQVNSLDNTGAPFSNSGNITYNRATTPIFKFDYTYWSSPVSPQYLLNVSPLSPAGLFLQFNSATNSWQYITSPGTTSMIPGKGYIFRAPTTYPTGAPATPQVYVASFIGVPNTGTITIPITGVASQFNLLGNPYPSALSADAFLLDAANAATLSGSIYLWTHNTPISAAYQYTGSDYAIYNYLGGIGTKAATTPGLNLSVPNGKIASGQGFFIKGLANGTATFKNDMRISGNNDQFFRFINPSSKLTTEIEKHRYWLNIDNTQGAFKQLLLGYVEGATFGLDRLFDGEMVDVGNVIGMYTLSENTKLSIQGRPLPFDINDIIPLGYKSTIASSYSISLPDYDGLFTNQKIYLEDKELHIIHDLKTNPYVFNTNIGTFDNRFVLRYTTETLGTEAPVFNENTVVIYKNTDNNFVITTGVFNMSSVKVFDIRGRLLLDIKDINAAQTIFNAGDTNQLLLVQIKTIDGITVNKKVVR